jgi:adenylate cyclase
MAQTAKRRLAAIVAMDVVGYSRMMATDEEGTLALLSRCRSQIIDPLIDQFGGRIVKTMGDGLLLEYPSAIAAVDAATKMQEQLSADTELYLDKAQFRFRTGIHIGDVIVQGEDIFGDGVNIAARIEPLAHPGGVSLSEDVYRMVHGRLNLAWTDAGLFSLKNIDGQVRIWNWMPENVATPSDTRPDPEHLKPPDKPSIAVLPFDNISGDPDQDLFADGLTEDLITDLSKISGLFVVASSSTIAVKDQNLDLAQTGARLGVRHILKGSVRKAGTRVRINAQLVDATQGGNLWAERFDGTIDDVFELQDEVGKKVVAALAVSLSVSEDSRLQQVHTQSMDAYELYVRAKATPFPPVPDRIKAARELFEQVIELDPNFAGGYAGLSWMLTFFTMLGHTPRKDAMNSAREAATKAIDIDPNFAWSHIATGLTQLLAGDHAAANASLDRALELSPSDADAHSFKGFVAAVSGQPEQGAEYIKQALRLNPQFIMGPYMNLLCLCNVLARDYEGAIAWFTRNSGRQGPVGPPVLSWIAAAYLKVGDEAGARNVLDILARNFPQFRLANWNFPKIIKSKDDRDELCRLMIAAGVPE